MSFYIQASNPRTNSIANPNDKTLADAIETTFLLKTENAILMWNYISVPLSYKYDISYMMEDILLLLNVLQSRENGELAIHWLPDTFRCDWTVQWAAGEITVHSQWESTVGHLEVLLNEVPDIILKKEDFLNEWKSVLGIVITGLENCGYEVKQIKGMEQLIGQYRAINGDGILYKGSSL